MVQSKILKLTLLYGRGVIPEKLRPEYEMPEFHELISS